MTTTPEPTIDKDIRANPRLGRVMLHDFVHRKLVEARASGDFDALARLPQWAQTMIGTIGRAAGVKQDAVAELVGDDT